MAKKARDLILENRQRIAIQSELVKRGGRIDPAMREQLQTMVRNRKSDVVNEMANLHARYEMVENTEDYII